LIWAYDNPHPGATRLKSLSRDAVVEIYDAISTEGLLSHNLVWYLTSSGWVYSAWVQPVRQQFNPVVCDVPQTGFWAQVSVPYVEALSQPDAKSARLYRLYYSSVHLVVAHVQDALGQPWYQIRDNLAPGRPQYVRAENLRPISPEEMAPISPDVEDKLIQVNIQQQMLYAYERGSLVFSTRCATGASFNVENQGIVNFGTPYGEHRVIRKSPSQHMRGGLGRSDYYDLPGVPFCTYFTTTGVAVHGAYWHNDFGAPRSHGCVNVMPEAAQWVYRWSLPVASYTDTNLEVKQGGTPIVVG
jgi:lipoprotein-anchoring transpeptidase ErfK/SrfK